MFDWPHAPLHRLNERGTYMVTAGTYGKTHHFNSSERLKLLCGLLLSTAQEFNWHLQAWAVMENHYHFIGVSLESAQNLRQFVKKLHAESAKEINNFDSSHGRKVWYQYWDSRITYQKSYYARLNYVHNNPVRHGIVRNAEEYDFCSAAWFKRNSKSSFRKTVESFKTDRLNVIDDF